MILRKSLVAALAALTPFVATSAIAASLTVGFSQIGSESGWRAAETSVSKSEAQKRNITLKIADAQQKQENQIKAIRSFVAQGVDAIFLAPVVATGWDAVLSSSMINTFRYGVTQIREDIVGLAHGVLRRARRRARPAERDDRGAVRGTKAPPARDHAREAEPAQQ